MSLQRVAKARPGRRRLRRILVILVISILAGGMGVAFLNGWMVRIEADRVYTQIKNVPAQPVALVLGAGPGSLYLEDRLDAAAELYRAGKVRHLLVSGAGDEASPYRSETRLMRLGLIARGVPSTAITRDDAGWRTLDSVARAKKVFGLDAVVIVSQGYHLSRALYLAHCWGLNAVGYAAADPGGDFYDNQAREWLARVLAVADTTILNRQPRTYSLPSPIILTPLNSAP